MRAFVLPLLEKPKCLLISNAHQEELSTHHDLSTQGLVSLLTSTQVAKHNDWEQNLQVRIQGV